MAYEDTFIELQNTLRTLDEALGRFGRRADRRPVLPSMKIADLKFEPMIRYANEERFNEVARLVSHARILTAKLITEYDEELEDLRLEMKEEKNG